MRMNHDIDVRNVLPSIRVPTLVMNRADDDPTIVGGSRYLAEHIPGARHVELAGADHAPSSGDAGPVLRELQSFLQDAWQSAQEGDDHETVLATVLFTDIIGSTERIAQLGDRRWRTLLDAHHAEVRRQLLRFRGVEMDTAGDGFFARFDGPARAIRCATTIASAVNVTSRLRRLNKRAGDAERQRRARDRKRLAQLPEGDRLEAAATIAGPESHAVEPTRESARQHPEPVERGLDPDGGMTITLPNGRRIGYWPDDGPREHERARRMIQEPASIPTDLLELRRGEQCSRFVRVGSTPIARLSQALAQGDLQGQAVGRAGRVPAILYETPRIRPKGGPG
jgi:hypothetical protein